MFQKSFYMFKALKKNMWTCGFFFQKPFFLSNVHQIISFLKYICIYIFHKKGSICSKHSKNKNTYTLLDFYTQTSLSTIIILNL
jgi:hypothetical protein